MITFKFTAAVSALLLAFAAASGCRSQDSSTTTTAACGAESSASFTGDTSHSGGIHDFDVVICPAGQTVYGFYRVSLTIPFVGVRLFRNKSFTKAFAGRLSIESMGSVRPIFATNSTGCEAYWRKLPRRGNGRKISVLFGLPPVCKELPRL